jgi:predicted outer membrane repeat protein
MLGIRRTDKIMPTRRGALVRASTRPAHHRRRGAWSVEYLEGRTLLSNFIVTNINDAGAGSLRQAIIDSNKDTTTGPNEIDFFAGLSGTIALTSGELLIENRNVSIVGPGQYSLSVSGNGTSRVFEVASGVMASLSGMTINGGLKVESDVTASLSGITITGGIGETGAGIFNEGTMTLDACTIAGNSAALSGGGIFNTGTMTIIASNR